MSTVYRIQCTICACGPFNCSCARWAEERKALMSKSSTDFFLSTRPGMYIDFPREKYPQMEQFYCGFSSVEQIFEWFSNYELDGFRKNGFVLQTYDVMPEDLAKSKSGSQVFFRRINCMLLRSGEVPRG